ncbi:DoxX family protein [Candidatus Venteria ishoeyi]|uniref:DoxX n=1 Tax=Candidatus Venteria ishoeyi TaxID=1899563 RepID=A0A1H6FDZ3_9GAMM|nr:DoxX family protein [Candidatus Venteria ishoeyi]MDM8545104.1 DoxX family protein [Candidatus Venteria ishoeyi]SEH07873.1 DoxX [Candidatus Venteria ishoeyi]
MINKLIFLYLTAVRGMQTFITPFFDFALRFWVAKIFFMSGLTKIDSWSSTLALFEYEYAVPLLPPHFAAYLGTGAELFFPVLLVIGLFSRFAALSLFIFNLVAMYSYPDLGIAGIKDHMLWGTMLAVTFFHGSGALSLDYWIYRKSNVK